MNMGSRRVARWLPNKVILTQGSRTAKRLYLTFDDGPIENHTVQLLALLDRYQVPASFFCVGTKVQQHPALVELLQSKGHLVGNHSLNHKAFCKLSIKEKLKEINDCDLLIRKITGDNRIVFRAPQGHIDIGLLYALTKKSHKIAHWSYDSLDYRNSTTAKALEVFENQPVTSGDIILFHDDNDLCINLLEHLLPQWIDEGYSFATVAELIEH